MLYHDCKPASHERWEGRTEEQDKVATGEFFPGALYLVKAKDGIRAPEGERVCHDGRRYDLSVFRGYHSAIIGYVTKHVTENRRDECPA